METPKKETSKKETSPAAEKKAASSLNIFQRMIAATAEINRVAKNLTVGKGQNSYRAVGEADVLAAVKPVEERFGIYSFPFARKIIKDEERDRPSDYDSTKKEYFLRIETVYRFINVDNPAEYIDITTYGDGVDSLDKTPGKAMTYGDKYALLKAYKIETGDDPDQFHSEDRGAKGQVPKPPKQVDKPTPEQLKQAQDLGIDLNKLATYLKCQVVEISTTQIAEAIEMKQKALAKQQAKVEPKTEPTADTAAEPTVEQPKGEQAE